MPPTFPEARFLVVDDQESSLILLERLLRWAGYSHIKGVTDPRQALSEIRASEPDCILLDHHMPHLTGLEVLKQVRSRKTQGDFLPVVMVTASQDESIKNNALEAGVNEFLCKPVHAPELALRVGNLLQIRALTQGLRHQNTVLEDRVKERTRALVQREVEARKSAEHFRFLSELSGRMETLYDPLQVAREPLESLLRLMGLNAGILFLVRDGLLEPGVEVGEFPPEVKALLGPRPFPTESVLVAEALRTQGPVVVSDYRAWPDARHQDVGLRTVMAVPIFLAGRPHSLMFLASFEREVPDDPANRILLQATGARIERALEQSAHVRTLHSVKHQALRVVGLTLEYRDYETKGHTDRVTGLALQLGRALKLDESALEQLRLGGYLHDAGKVAIPDQILLKPDTLTAEEFETVKRHVTIGEEMLCSLSFIPAEVFGIIRHHHERWDGSGYPDGLAGNDIPLLARVFSVVDVYDALTSQRPYKHAWSKEMAVTELVDQRGKQFDPQVVEAFLEVVREN